jgi:hypothetical protein
MDTETNGCRKTKESRDEIHETHRKIHLKTRRYEDNLDAFKVHPVEKKLAQCKKNG